jgi:hypothetical protein
MRGHRPDAQSTVGRARDAAELLDPAQADDVARTEETLAHEEDRGRAAGQKVRIVAVARKQL